MQKTTFLTKTLRLLTCLPLWLCLTACGSPTAAPVPTATPLPPPTAAPTQTSTPAVPGWCSPSGALTGDFLVIGYLPDYRSLNPEWGNCLTDLIYFSAEPLADGTLDTSRLAPSTLSAMQEMKATYGTHLHIGLGGYGRSDGFGPMVTDPQAREKFIGELLTFASQNSLDGIDFDWEFPANDAEVEGYLIVMDAVHAAGLIVSVALYPYPDLDLGPYRNVDRIHIMSYDRGYRHSTYEQAVDDLDFFLQGGIPADRLVLGVPFYGRDTTSYAPYTYADIVQDYAPAADVDEVGGIYFNGITTLQQKTCYALLNGFGGVMIWELGQDSPDDSSLLRGIYTAATGECLP